MITGVVSSVLRAVGLGLLVAGAFADRGSVRASGFAWAHFSIPPPLAGWRRNRVRGPEPAAFSFLQRAPFCTGRLSIPGGQPDDARPSTTMPA